MSLIMTKLPELLGLGDMMIPGIIIGVIGMVMALVTFPIYCRILTARIAKYGPQIVALSDEILM